jgi:uncharacterized membrane protein YkvA (DUF1232 family)
MSVKHQANPSPRALRHFEALTRSVTPEHLETLREDVDRHLLGLQKLAQRSEMMPLDLAEGIANGLHKLLDDVDKLPAEHQSAIVGAALYFISTEDELPDRESILGLDDDAEIFNYVAELVGHGELKVEL